MLVTVMAPHGQFRRSATFLSRYFMPTLRETQVSEQVHSASAELLERAGYIRKSSAGIYNFLPLGERVISKLTSLIDREMSEIGASKCALASMQPHSLWQKTGRSSLMGQEMFHLAGNELVLAPTHEEEITQLIASTISSYRQLPLRLYQIGIKYRNEARPKGGLLRCREFLMKDLYTFDCSAVGARETYNSVCAGYQRLFSQLELPFHQARASTGAIGGSLSHEFHIESASGQDTLLHCSDCGFCGNAELIAPGPCPECAQGQLQSKRGLEIGHTFILGTRYSAALGATFKNAAGDNVPMEMGCYGIGVSRLMAAVVECSHDAAGIRWPRVLSPFSAYVLSASDEEPHLVDGVPQHLLADALIDNRPNMSFSRKFKDALLSGIPDIVVVGSRQSKTGVEWHQRTANGTKLVDAECRQRDT